MQGISADRGLVVDKMGCGQEKKIHTKEMRHLVLYLNSNEFLRYMYFVNFTINIELLLLI